MPELPPADAPGPWFRRFRATPDNVGEARRFLVTALGGHPATDDAQLCLAELAANAITHSRSALSGGTFAVRVRRSGPAIRVEITDDGGPWRCQPDDPEHGRGLRIVRALCSRCDITVKGPRDDPAERTVSFEMPLWPPR